jgi:hypothetical protein
MSESRINQSIGELFIELVLYPGLTVCLTGVLPGTRLYADHTVQTTLL